MQGYRTWDAGSGMQDMSVGSRRWDAGDGMQDARIQDIGCGMQVVRCRVWDVGSGMQDMDVGCRIWVWDAEGGMEEVGCRTLEVGCR